MTPQAFYFDPPANIPPALDPLTTENSIVASDAEAALQDAFVAVFNTAIRPRMSRVNTYGMPHRGDSVTLERAVKQAGLAMDHRIGGEVYMRELFRAWMANNPRRGLAFLRTFLQLLYPGASTVEQLWHSGSTSIYPAGASPTQYASSFLTSRVRISLPTTSGLTATDISRIRSVAMSVIPARIVLEIVTTLGGTVQSQIRMAAAGTSDQVVLIGGMATLAP